MGKKNLSEKLEKNAQRIIVHPYERITSPSSKGIISGFRHPSANIKFYTIIFAPKRNVKRFFTNIDKLFFQNYSQKFGVAIHSHLSVGQSGVKINTVALA